MNDPDDDLPALLRDVERDVRDEARAAARPRLDALVDHALAAAAASPSPAASPRPHRRAWVFALAATLGVATALAAGVAVWRRPAEPRRGHVEQLPTTPPRTPAPAERTPARPRALEEADAAAPPPVLTPPAPPTVVRRPRAPEAAPSPVALGETPASLYRRANEARRARAHDEAASLYRTLLAAHPDAPESQQARVTLGRLLLDRGGDAREAESLFAAYLRREPRGIEAETAMAGRARALQGMGRARDERAAWSALLAAFPESVHADEARRRVAELGE